MIRHFDDLLRAARGRESRKIAIAAPEDRSIIQLVRRSREEGVADFILVGDERRLRPMLKEEGVDPEDIEIQNSRDHREAAEKAVGLVAGKKAGAVMKGELQTSVFLKALLDREKGLRNGGLVSQITVCEKVEGEGLLLITDCAMNIRPTLEEKKQIIENAVELALKLGYEKPKVAVLSAIEVLNPDIPDTLDAAVLSKMASRGQIKNAVVDGPFALDNAVSARAAGQKKIDGEVAGRADIILVPNLQVGNPLHKALTFFAGRPVAASVMGAAAPVVMLSRADTVETKMRSIALATYVS